MGAATRWVAALVGGALLLAAWAGSDLDDAHLARTAPPAAAKPPVAPPPVDALAALNRAAPATPRAPEAFARWMSEESSLRGADLDGAWDVDPEGRLVPTIALRRRFDQLLSLAGEANLDETRGFIAHDVRELAGAEASLRVLAVWDRYVELQRVAFQQVADMRDRSTWSAALAERQRVRQRLLGMEVARAFFADEEAQLEAAARAAAPAAQPAQDAIDRPALSPAAAESLRREEQAWADWERRLANARREHAALEARGELSSPQRVQLMERHVATHFAPSEAVRVRALLQLPVGGG